MAYSVLCIISRCVILYCVIQVGGVYSVLCIISRCEENSLAVSSAQTSFVSGKRAARVAKTQRGQKEPQRIQERLSTMSSKALGIKGENLSVQCYCL